MAPGVPGQIMLSPHVAPALPISPVMESMATMGQKQHMEINDLGQQNQHLNLEVADKALQIKQLGETHMSSNEDSDDDDDDDDEDDGITITGLSIN